MRRLEVLPAAIVLPGREILEDPLHHMAHEVLDVVHERLELAAAALDLLEPLLPGTGHRGALDLFVHLLDQQRSLGGRPQRLLAPLQVAPRQQRLDGGGAGRGRAQAAVAHGVRELPVVQRAAGRLHGGQQRALGMVAWRPCLFFELAGVLHLPRLPLRQPRRQHRLVFLAALACRFAPGGVLARLELQHPPALLLHGGAVAAVAVQLRSARSQRGLDAGDHRGHRRQVVVEPGAQQAAADQVVDPPLVPAQGAGAGICGGGDDGVVIGDLAVVHVALAELARAHVRRQQVGVWRRHGLHDLVQSLLHVGGEVAAVGARIADQLVLFVQRLGQLEGPVRGESEEPVGVALQLCQIVQQGRSGTPLLALDGLDACLPLACALQQRVGHLAVCGQARALFGVDAGPLAKVGALVAGGLLTHGRRGCLPAGGLRGRRPRARIRPKGGPHLQVGLGHKIGDGLVALHHHAERGGLHPSYREDLIALSGAGWTALVVRLPGALAQGVGAGEVHPHQPVGPAAPARGVGQRIKARGVGQHGETFADGVRRQRGDPQSLDRLLALAVFVDVAENQLALTARVGGRDHLLDSG